jgi:hypothetical protein
MAIAGVTPGDGWLAVRYAGVMRHPNLAGRTLLSGLAGSSDRAGRGRGPTVPARKGRS